MQWLHAVPWAGVIGGVAIALAIALAQQIRWVRYWRREALIQGRMNGQLIEENERLAAMVRGSEPREERYE